jgi:hypothetical protein
MAGVTIAMGLLLTLLGIGAYFATGQQSVTALIPSFIGIPLALLGLLARDPGKRKTAMHIAVVLALLGFLGSARGFPAAIALASGEEVARPAAAVVQAVMAVLCAIYLVLAVKSFMNARKSRLA